MVVEEAGHRRTMPRSDEGAKEDRDDGKLKDDDDGDVEGR